MMCSKTDPGLSTLIRKTETKMPFFSVWVSQGVERISPVHTKSRLAIAHGNVETVYYQASENVLAATLQQQHSEEKGPAALAAPTTLVVQLDTGGFGSSGYRVSLAHGTVAGWSPLLVAGGPSPGSWGIASDVTSGVYDLVTAACFDSLEALRHGLAENSQAQSGRSSGRSGRSGSRSSMIGSPCEGYTTNSTLLFVGKHHITPHHTTPHHTTPTTPDCLSIS